MKKILISTLALLLLAGCSKSEQDTLAGSSAPDLSAPVVLSAGVRQGLAVKAALGGPVAGTSFPVGTTDVFRLTAYAGSSAPTTWGTSYFSDVQVDADASGRLTPVTPLYYPASGDKLFFYAYSPAPTSLTAGGAQPPVAHYTLSGQQDILAAQETSGIAKASFGALQPQPSLAFSHKLMQVRFKLVADASFPASGVRVTQVQVKGVKTAAQLDISTGALSFGAATGDLTLPITAGTKDEITTAGTEMTGCLMFEASSTFTVSVIAGGVTYADAAVTLAGADAGKAGTSHLVTLTFLRTGITSTASIADWTDAGLTDADIQ